MKVKLLFIFAMLLTAVSGAWAQNPSWLRDGDTWDDATKTLTVKSNPVAGAYREIAEIEIVIFDTSVTSINQNAFDGCTGLTSITIPEDHGVGSSTDHFLKFLYYTSFLTPHDPTSKFST